MIFYGGKGYIDHTVNYIVIIRLKIKVNEMSELMEKNMEK